MGSGAVGFDSHSSGTSVLFHGMLVGRRRTARGVSRRCWVANASHDDDGGRSRPTSILLAAVCLAVGARRVQSFRTTRRTLVRSSRRRREAARQLAAPVPGCVGLRLPTQRSRGRRQVQQWTRRLSIPGGQLSRWWLRCGHGPGMVLGVVPGVVPGMAAGAVPSGYVEFAWRTATARSTAVSRPACVPASGSPRTWPLWKQCPVPRRWPHFVQSRAYEQAGHGPYASPTHARGHNKHARPSCTLAGSDAGLGRAGPRWQRAPQQGASRGVPCLLHCPPQQYTSQRARCPDRLSRSLYPPLGDYLPEASTEHEGASGHALSTGFGTRAFLLPPVPARNSYAAPTGRPTVLTTAGCAPSSVASPSYRLQHLDLAP